MGGTNHLAGRLKMGLAQNREKEGKEGRGLEGQRDLQSHDGGVPNVERHL